MTIASQITTLDATDVCRAPAIGGLLAEYITDLLDDSQAELIELHLADCEHCKARYLTVLRVRHEAETRRSRRTPKGPVVVPVIPTAPEPERKGQAKAKGSSS